MGATINKAPAAEAVDHSNLAGAAKLQKLAKFARLMAKWQEEQEAAKQIVWEIANPTTSYEVYDENDYEAIQSLYLEGSQGPDHIRFYTRE